MSYGFNFSTSKQKADAANQGAAVSGLIPGDKGIASGLALNRAQGFQLPSFQAQAPMVDAGGFLPGQEGAANKLMTSLFSQFSGQGAQRGFLNPQHTSAVAGSALTQALPQLLQQFAQNQQIQEAGQQGRASLMNQGQISFLDVLARLLGSESTQTGASASRGGSLGFGVFGEASGGSSGGASGGASGGGGAVCWIAAALYGEGSHEQCAIRAWLLAQAEVSRFWAGFVAIYRRYGKRIAHTMSRSRVLTACIRPIFDAILRRAWPNR